MAFLAFAPRGLSLRGNRSAEGPPLNTFIWCSVGLLAGGIAIFMIGAQGLVHRIETLAVAVFGAFIGGDFLGAQFGGGPADTSFRATSLALALGGAVVMLLLLRLMRRSVGPMRPHKMPRKQRF
jgi:uncharacterized membrane protein YeaQ/YmgE (transglycosylase-associated protein family)